MSDKLFTPSNPNAQQGVRNVLKYLSDITYEKIITGQHTQTMAQEELHLIEKVTGKQPALLGFELLSYSPNINYFDIDDECMTEVTENYGTLKKSVGVGREKGAYHYVLALVFSALWKIKIVFQRKYRL